MANDLNIESLSIEFQVTSASAMDAVDKLVEKMNKLKAATQGGLQGASSMAKSLEKIAQAAKSFNGVDMSKLTGLSDAMTRLNGITASGNLAGVAAQMRDLTKIGNAVAGLPSVASGQLQTITGISSALQSLANIPRLPDLSSTARSLTQLGSVASSITAVDMSAAAQKIRELTSALRPLETLGKTNLSSFINSLKKLPDISATLSAMDMTAFAGQIQSVATAISPLTTEIQRMAAAVGALPQPIQNAVAGLINYNNTAWQAGSSTDGLLRKIKNLLSLGSIIAITRRIKSLFGGMIESSNMFVENMNLFAVSMGNAADEALNFANRVNQLMGIDVSQWIENQGYFKQIASGFGVVEDKANLMSQNLTQLGFDIASFYNISVESAMQKLQSGISGEIMPLRSLGYALDESTLKQIAYNHGITDSITNMTQAQKSQIRYIAIMEQSKNAMGDMARTLESPANQMRIFEQRVDQLKRAIGNGLMPIISAALPWVTAFVKLLTEGAQKIADFLGFEIPKFDYGDLVAQSNKGVSSSFDDATKAAKEFKGTLSSIDQLNIIGSDTESSKKGIGDMYDLNVDLPSYDFLGGLEESTDKAYNTIKRFMNNVKNTLDSSLIWQFFKGIGGFVLDMAKNIDSALPIIEGLGAAFLTFGVISGIQSVVTAFKSLSIVMSPAVFTITTAVGAFVLFKNTVKNLMTSTKNLAGNIASLVTGVVAVGAAMAGLAVSGHPIMAVAVAVGAVAGAMAGAISVIHEQNAAIADMIMYADNGGISIRGLADGFSGYFSEISSHYDDILKNTSAFKDNESKISAAAGEINNMVSKYSALSGEMTVEDAETIKSNLEIIKNGVTESLGIGTQGIVSALGDTFRTTLQDMGLDVDNMISKFYLLESMGNAGLASTKRQADELAASLASGNLSAEEQKKALGDLQKTIEGMGISNIGTKEQFSFMESLKNMTEKGIDFEDEETFGNALNDLAEQAEAAKLSIETAKTDQLYELETMRQKYSTMIGESGLTVREEFGAAEFDALFDETKSALTAGFEADKNKIDTALGAFGIMVQSELNKNINTAFAETEGANIFDYLWANTTNLLTLQGINSELGATKAEEEAYNRIKNQYSGFQTVIDGMLKNVDTSISDEIGGYLIEGMANGVLDTAEKLYEALDAAANGSIDEVKRICGIASPSKVFYGIGEYLIEGLRLGVQSEESATLREFETFGKDLNSAIVIAPLDWSVLTDDTPDFSSAYTIPKNRACYAQRSEPAQATGYDVSSVVEVAQIMSSIQSDNVPEFTLYTTVEMDGAEVGTAVTRQQDYEKLLSNGR